MNHTPEPWEVALDSRSKAVIVHHQGKSIATVRGKNAENDAILITAAPELLEALEACVEELRLFMELHDKDGDTPVIHAMGIAAIAKAKGNLS